MGFLIFNIYFRILPFTVGRENHRANLKNNRRVRQFSYYPYLQRKGKY